jgi:prepilin-type processing-associated H-X9-DG protein
VWRSGSTFSAWEILSFSPPFRCSYGLNYALFTQEPYYPERHPFHGKYYPYLFSIRNVAGIPVLADSVSPGGAPRDDFTFGKPQPTDSGLNTRSWPFCINRHNEHINVLFLDWSVRKIGLKELWTLKWRPDFDTAGPWTRAGGIKHEEWPVWMRNFKDY